MNGDTVTPCSHSISRRLSRKLALLTVLVMGLLFVACWVSVSMLIKQRNATELAQRCSLVADILVLEAQAGGEAAMLARLHNDAPMRASSRLEVVRADGSTLYADAASPQLAASPHRLTDEFTIATPAGEYRGRYSADFSADAQMGERWAFILAAVTLAAGGVVALGARWHVRRALRPLEDLAAQTRAISPQALHRRLALPDPARELEPWIVQFNALMDRLERAYAQLEGFNADVAHELRTPLATLIGQTEVALARERSPDELRETLLSNLEEMQRLSAMVNDMLFLSHADRGAVARRGAPVSLAALAAQVCEFHEATLDEADLVLRIEGDAVLPVDEPLFKRALSNLLGNATRFAERGSTVLVRIDPQQLQPERVQVQAGEPHPEHVQGLTGQQHPEHVHVLTRQAHPEQVQVLTGLQHPEQVQVLVQNQGQPIAPQQLPRLFDRFFRGEASRCCPDEQHHGLGLAIVAAIARMHAGRTLAESQGGVTRVGFTLAAAGAAAMPAR